MNNEKKLSTKLTMVAVAALVLFLSRVMPLPSGLSREGLTALAIMVAGLCLWITEVMNMAVTTIIMCCMLTFFKVMTPAEMFKGFGGSVFFFMVGTMAITTALASTTVPTRIAGFILKYSKNSPVKLTLGFALGTAVLSSVMSNIPTCALFASLAIAVLKTNGNPKPGTSNLGKCLMIAIPAGSVIGGFMTPAGSPTNIIAYDLLASMGRPVTFLNWMIIGYPIGIALTILFCLWLCFFYRPEPITEEAMLSAKDMISGNGPLEAREIKCLCVIAVMVLMWVASTWLTFLNTTVVALFGTCMLMFPGIDVITWDQYVRDGGWEGTFLVGGVGAMAAAALSTGAASWIISVVLGGASSWSPWAIYLAVSLLICCLHWLCPSGPAVAGLAVAPIVLLAQKTGASVTALAMITSFWSGVTFLLPTDAVPMFTYQFGYYSIGDMAKQGWVPSLVFAVIVAFAIPLLTGVLGYV